MQDGKSGSYAPPPSFKDNEWSDKKYGQISPPNVTRVKKSKMKRYLKTILTRPRFKVRLESSAAPPDETRTGIRFLVLAADVNDESSLSVLLASGDENSGRRVRAKSNGGFDESSRFVERTV